MTASREQITIGQLIELVESSAVIEHGFEQVEKVVKNVSHSGEEELWFWGWVYNTLTAGELKITYQNSYEHPEFKPSLAELNGDIPDSFQLEKAMPFDVVDEDGNTLTLHEIGDILEEYTDLCDLDISLIGEDAVEDIDVDEDNDMKTITLEIDNAPNIRFTGFLEATVSSSDNNAHPDYSGTNGRWSELYLYKTKSGKFVCHQIGRTRWLGEHDRYTGKVCNTEAEVIDFFGQGWLSKELYAEAHIDNVVDLDGEDNANDGFIFTADDIETAQFYVDCVCPDMQGTGHEFEEDSNSNMDEAVTWIDGTDYTRDEYENLLQGDAVIDKLEAMIDLMVKNNPRVKELILDRIK